MERQPAPITTAIQQAAEMGVDVLLDGPHPNSQRLCELVALAIRECATNCVRHADGTELYVSLEQKLDYIYVSLTNNGSVPKGEILEGGGLSMLRQHVKKAGGKMNVQSIPYFKLTLSLPVEGDNNESDDC